MMKNKAEAVISKHQPAVATFPGYLIGFLLSVYLTISAYLMVVYGEFSSRWAITVIIGLALTQFIVQAIFFLHIGKESKPRWNMIMFSFMIMVAAIVIVGSLWIMANLDYHHGMSAEETNNMIIEDEGYKP